MFGSNLPFENEVELFGYGMGLLTVGATWFLVGLHGPLSSAVSTAVFAMSAPFMLVGLVAVTAPAFLTLPSESSQPQSTNASQSQRLSTQGPADD